MMHSGKGSFCNLRKPTINYSKSIVLQLLINQSAPGFTHFAAYTILFLLLVMHPATNIFVSGIYKSLTGRKSIENKYRKTRKYEKHSLPYFNSSVVLHNCNGTFDTTGETGASGPTGATGPIRCCKLQTEQTKLKGPIVLMG